jgi:Uncharacterised nucleotidyltransferase
MPAHQEHAAVLDADTRAFYETVLDALQRAEAPFLVGGAYALQGTAGIERHTKDLDLFVRRADLNRVLAILEDAGYRTEMVFSHWLAKAYGDGAFIDLIFSSGNGVANVDDAWFTHSVPGNVLGFHVRLCPMEEIIWSKAYIMERERFDGADIAHVLRMHAGDLNWRRLLDRFGKDWRVLFGHLVFFEFIYPGEQYRLPRWVMSELFGRMQNEADAEDGVARLCRGTLLSRQQYLVDVEEWGYADARLKPYGNMTDAQIGQWTAGIDWSKRC